MSDKIFIFRCSVGVRVGRWTLSVGRWAFALAFLLSTLLLSACGSQNFHVLSPGEGPTARRYLELRSEASAATLHFPAGTYALHAEDKVGYYYRAPGNVIQRMPANSVPRPGGIYVNKRNPQKLRGYIYLAGALTHVGNLSGSPHEFRD